MSFRRGATVVLLAALTGGCRTSSTRTRDEVTPATLPTAPASAVEDGRALFFRLVGGEKRLLPSCQDHWSDLHRRDPDSPLARAYLGATVAFSASLEVWPPRKGELAKRGLQLLEEAVSAAPQGVEVRFLRGMTSQSLPPFMGRRAIARGDLAHAAANAPAALAAGEITPPIAAAALYRHGLLREADGDHEDARRAFRSAVDLGPRTPSGLKARRKLDAGG